MNRVKQIFFYCFLSIAFVYGEECDLFRFPNKNRVDFYTGMPFEQLYDKYAFLDVNCIEEVSIEKKSTNGVENIIASFRDGILDSETRDVLEKEKSKFFYDENGYFIQAYYNRCEFPNSNTCLTYIHDNLVNKFVYEQTELCKKIYCYVPLNHGEGMRLSYIQEYYYSDKVLNKLVQYYYMNSKPYKKYSYEFSYEGERLIQLDCFFNEDLRWQYKYQYENDILVESKYINLTSNSERFGKYILFDEKGNWLFYKEYQSGKVLFEIKREIKYK